jgi:LmbE family N-acetylglucosaminyl deacetylase
MVLKSDAVIAVGSHPDDIELGCGGTMARLASNGKKVVAVFVTKGEKSGDPQIRMLESRQAMSILGVNEVHFGPFPDTEIPNNHEVVAFLEEIVAKYNAQTVLTHSIHDSHQDHRQIGWISMSAFRNITRLLAYESPRSTAGFSPSYYIDVTRFVDKKWAALKCHKTQQSKKYLTYESMVNLASFRGSQANVKSAEAFEVIRYIESEI